jgi:hypothetical protein
MITSLTILASILILVGWIWLIVLGFKRGGAVWGILNLFSSLIAGLVFCIVKKEGWTAWILLFAGWCIVMFYLQPWERPAIGAAY